MINIIKILYLYTTFLFYDVSSLNKSFLITCVSGVCADIDKFQISLKISDWHIISFYFCLFCEKQQLAKLESINLYTIYLTCCSENCSEDTGFDWKAQFGLYIRMWMYTLVYCL